MRITDPDLISCKNCSRLIAEPLIEAGHRYCQPCRDKALAESMAAADEAYTRVFRLRLDSQGRPVC